jgi:hypothetical protein
MLGFVTISVLFSLAHFSNFFLVFPNNPFACLFLRQPPLAVAAGPFGMVGEAKRKSQGKWGKREGMRIEEELV